MSSGSSGGAGAASLHEIFGAGERPYRAGPVCLDSCLLEEETLKNSCEGATIPKTDAMFAAFQPATVGASAMDSGALAPSEEATLTAPGRSVRRLSNPQGAPTLSGVLGGGENVEIQSDFGAGSLGTIRVSVVC